MNNSGKPFLGLLILILSVAYGLNSCSKSTAEGVFGWFVLVIGCIICIYLCDGLSSNNNSQTTHNANNSNQNKINTPKCPTCQSTNIKSISGTKRAVHGYAFGLYSKTARSQFECSDCGYKW